MVKKKFFLSLIYFGVMITIGGIVTHNEYIQTSLIINFWFSVPMTICYFVEILCFKKVSNVSFFIIAIVNTIIVFAILCAVGSYILYKYMHIPF